MHWLQTTVVLAALFVCAVAARATAQTSADLFAPGTIRDIRITMSARDWDTLREQFLLNTYYAGDVRIGLDGGEVVARNVGIRSRGSGSRSGVKPALKIDISRYVSGQRFLGLRALILRNLLQDASMVHEYITFELQRRLGLPVPRTVFARLFVNDQYSGLYELIEDVDEEFLDRVAGEHAGYLYEYAWTRPYYFEYLGSALEPYAALWEPKTRDKEPPSLLYGPLEAMARTIRDSRDRDFVTEAGALIDLQQVLRLVAADNFMADWDGMLGYAGLNNIYMYRPLGGPAVIIPWDKDNALHAPDYSAFEGTRENALVARAMRDPRLRDVYLATLQMAAVASREPVAPVPPVRPIAGVGAEPLGWLEALVESTARLIRKAAWADPVKPSSNEQFEAAIAEARRFARIRASIVEEQIRTELNATASRLSP